MKRQLTQKTIKQLTTQLISKLFISDVVKKQLQSDPDVIRAIKDIAQNLQKLKSKQSQYKKALQLTQ